MKKIFLGLLLLLSISMFSQETFVKKYTSFITNNNYVLGKWERTDVTVVFNPKGIRDIVFYYTNGSVRTFHQVTSIQSGKTKNNDGYQIVECIDDEDGAKVAIQLFDDDTCLRIIIDAGYYIEFHRD
jgi:hypothetical protein